MLYKLNLLKSLHPIQNQAISSISVESSFGHFQICFFLLFPFLPFYLHGCCCSNFCSLFECKIGFIYPKDCYLNSSDICHVQITSYIHTTRVAFLLLLLLLFAFWFDFCFVSLRMQCCNYLPFFISGTYRNNL